MIRITKQIFFVIPYDFKALSGYRCLMLKFILQKFDQDEEK